MRASMHERHPDAHGFALVLLVVSFVMVATTVLLQRHRDARIRRR